MQTVERRGLGGIWARRIVAIPGILLICAMAVVLLPVTLAAALVADAFRRKRMATTRMLLMSTFFLLVEAAGILMAGAAWVASGFGLARGPYAAWNDWLQIWWGNALHQAIVRLLDVQVQVGGASICSPGPIIVFIRHSSVADTVTPSALISRALGMRLRFVVKRELLWDPCMNLVGTRRPNCFVERGAGGEAAWVARLADGLGERDGILIYPEGMVLTPAKARATAAEPGAKKDRGYKDVHAPRLGGPLALLERAKGVDVVFVGHVGYEVAPGVRQLLRGDLIGARVQMSFWRVPGSEVPETREGRARWLRERWHEMDDWVGAHQRSMGVEEAVR